MASNTVQPLQTRIVALDVLRGFALFGVLLVNMIDFSSSAFRDETLGARGSGLDQALDIAVVIFAVTKFYLLFSFLFGVGFAVQMSRLEATGRPVVAFFLRRLGVLMIIGLLHATLLWDGDILRLYAAAGLMLLVVRRVPTEALLALAGFIGLAGFLFFANVESLASVSTSLIDDGINTYQSGSYWDVVNYRLQENLVAIDIQIPMVLVMFLLGLVVGRSGVLSKPEIYQPFLRRYWKPALALGLLGNGLMLIGFEEGILWMVSFGVHVGAPALSFAYLAGVLLNTERLAFLAPVGQMALTNYLTHSLVATTLFYGYGFGLYNDLSVVAANGLVLLIFGMQIIISRWWMRGYRFGPMEWVWRSLTYWRVQPIRRMNLVPSISSPQ